MRRRKLLVALGLALVAGAWPGQRAAMPRWNSRSLARVFRGIGVPLPIGIKLTQVGLTKKGKSLDNHRLRAG
jgi:hypothetical protein